MDKRKFFAVVLTLAALWGSKWAWDTYDQSLGFTIRKISASLPHHPEWSSELPSSQIQNILSQQFSFLGEGAQAYAFESTDGKYVLKLFKMCRFTPSMTDYLCPHLVKRRVKNLRWVFNGYKTAYERFREDTGLVYIHLNRTDGLKRYLDIVDDKGAAHSLDLDQAYFIVQEKAELIFTRLKKLYDAGDVAAAEKSIASVLKLVQRRVSQGYADRDKAVSNNYGFVDNKPIHLDVGRLYLGEKPGQVEHVSRRIDRWKESNSCSQCGISSG